MKTCFKCGQTKPLTDFYRHPAMADGHLGKCKECAKKDVKENYEANREKKSEYEARRNQLPARKAAKIVYRRNRRARHPEKDAARAAVARAITSRSIVRHPCCYCGALKVQAHHHDYSKPLDVTWVCFKCHREREHGQVVVTKNWTPGGQVKPLVQQSLPF